MSNNFHVESSQSGYRVELYRGGKPYVTFADGISKEVAEQVAQSLNRMWQRIGGRDRSAPSVAANSEKHEARCAIPAAARRN